MIFSETVRFSFFFEIFDIFLRFSTKKKTKRTNSHFVLLDCSILCISTNLCLPTQKYKHKIITQSTFNVIFGRGVKFTSSNGWELPFFDIFVIIRVIQYHNGTVGFNFSNYFFTSYDSSRNLTKRNSSTGQHVYSNANLKGLKIHIFYQKGLKLHI